MYEGCRAYVVGTTDVVASGEVVVTLCRTVTIVLLLLLLHSRRCTALCAFLLCCRLVFVAFGDIRLCTAGCYPFGTAVSVAFHCTVAVVHRSSVLGGGSASAVTAAHTEWYECWQWQWQWRWWW